MAVTESATDAPLAGDVGNPAHPAAHSAGAIGLAVGALGVVFGDIGTSPLYALQTVFSIDHGAVHPTSRDVYGVISLVFWSITLIVSVKYVVFVLRADNDGEGGVMALAALMRRLTGGFGRLTGLVMILGVFGACLFYGDSVITPAISVLSSVEGLEVYSSGLKDAVLPIGVVILAVLFAAQRWGTSRVGRLFGPVMIVWFVAIAAAGLPKIIAHPGILRGLSPTYCLTFIADHPYTAFIAMGAVVLVITGAEALYADMGHFGRPPIRRAWFAVVFPALTINYLGQGALILHTPGAISNPFYLLVPSWARIPMIVLATFATVIASQAVISGAYSVSRQAVRLGFLPHLTVRQTSSRESGQIYVPAVNWLLFGGVLVLMFSFRSSNKLATAYGVAVTGTLVITTILFLVVATKLWRWPLWKLVLAGLAFGVVEVTFFLANLTKIVHGGWLPLLLAAAIFTLMTTWQRGREIVTKRRVDLEGSLADFVADLRRHEVARVPGTAVFPHPTKETTPLALRANVRYNGVLHEHVVIISVHGENVPHVPLAERVVVNNLGFIDDGIVHLDVRFGFQDEQDIPETLGSITGEGAELDFDASGAFYFLSRITLRRGAAPGMPTWRKRIFLGLAAQRRQPGRVLPPARGPHDRHGRACRGLTAVRRALP